MTDKTIEDVYAALADGIDKAGREREAFYLSKVALLLAHALGQPENAIALIEDALHDLDPMTKPGNR